MGVPPVPLRRAISKGRLLAGTIAPMTTANVRAHEESLVGELYGRGLSIRGIAKRAGFSRPKVDRILRRLGLGPRLFSDLPEPDNGDDLDDDLALLDGDPERVVVPPLTYVGTERHRGKVYARWVDTVGPVNELDIYRYRFRNGSEGDDELDADMARQLIAAGCWQLDHGGYYPTWEPPPKPATELPARCECPEHREPAVVWSYTPASGAPLAGINVQMGYTRGNVLEAMTSRWH